MQKRPRLSRFTRLGGEQLEPRLALAIGPQLLADINPGAAPSVIGELTPIGNTAYFAADNGQAGVELWKTDGTAAGTTLVKDINPGPGNSNPSSLTNVNGTLYFRANDGVHGNELWKSDGTADGTVMVDDIVAGSSGSYPGNFVNVSGRLYFTASSTASGVTRVFGPSPYLSSADSPFDLSQLGTNFWLEDFEDGLLNTTGVSANAGSVRAPSTLTDSVDADDGAIDGSGHLGSDYLVRPGSTGVSFQFDSTALGGLPSHVGIVITNGFGGSPSSTVEFYDGAGILIARQSVLIDNLHNATADARFVGAFHAGGIKTIRITSLGTGNSGLEVDHLQYGDVVQPIISGGLWTSDGTPDGTTFLKKLNFDPVFSAAALNGNLVFAADDGLSGTELWTSDGTPAGTTQILDVNPGIESSNPQSFAMMNGALYFQADDGASGQELWKTDGTPGGTILVKDIHAGALGSIPAELTDVNGTLFFRAADGTTGGELWRSDGTEAGTALVKDVRPGIKGSGVSELTAVGNTLYFIANDSSHLFELWKSDGTAAGTTMVKDIVPGGSSSNPMSLTNINDLLLFGAFTPTTGEELWQSDGTSSGTQLIDDIYAGGQFSAPLSIIRLAKHVVFTADDGIHGRELWSFDINDAPSFTMPDQSFIVSDEMPPVYSASNASTISFNDLSGHQGDGDPFTTYTEGRFTVTPVTGRWMVMTTVSPTPDVFGNPPPSIWEDTFTASLDVTQSSGGVFRFDGIDLTRSTNYTLTGLLGDQTVFTASGTVPAGPAGFMTVQSTSSATIDRLRISVVRNDVETTNIDNIRLGVPVPSETVPEWLTNRSAGPPDESSQALTLTVTNTNPGLFVDPPDVDYKGTLRFTPAPNAAGSATVTVTLQDAGGTLACGVVSYSRMFMITVTRPHPYRNGADNLDVSSDGFIAPNDALAIINYLNAGGTGPVPADPSLIPFYYDVSGDNFVAPNDALTVINYLNDGKTSAPAAASATFVGLDATTQGNWPLHYGADGYALDSERTALPAYASLSITGALTDVYDYIVAMSTTDPRALQKPDGSGRLIATWTGDYGMTLDINITDGQTHQVALYMLDAYGNGNSQRLDVFDAATGNVLDSRSISSFDGGQYLVWNLSGHVQIRFTNLANGLNTVLSGILFGGPAAP
jgi:ELWxxDGT repeat protein